MNLAKNAYIARACIDSQATEITALLVPTRLRQASSKSLGVITEIVILIVAVVGVLLAVDQSENVNKNKIKSLDFFVYLSL
jgi:hypothetical protein